MTSSCQQSEQKQRCMACTHTHPQSRCQYCFRAALSRCSNDGLCCLAYRAALNLLSSLDFGVSQVFLACSSAQTSVYEVSLAVQLGKSRRASVLCQLDLHWAPVLCSSPLLLPDRLLELYPDPSSSSSASPTAICSFVRQYSSDWLLRLARSRPSRRLAFCPSHHSPKVVEWLQVLDVQQRHPSSLPDRRGLWTCLFASAEASSWTFCDVDSLRQDVQMWMLKRH